MRVNPRATRITLKFCPAARCVRLTVPRRISWRRAEAFLAAQEAWVAEAAARLMPPPKAFCPGLVLPFAGGTLELADTSGRRIVREGDQLRVPGEGTLYEGRVRRWLAAEALRLLEAETRALAAPLDRPVKRVAVGDPCGRWGSCGADGRIRYSWRLILAPEFVRRAVVAHEVAHLIHLNHGPGFRALADELLAGSQDEARAWLKANGAVLHSYGAAEVSC